MEVVRKEIEFVRSSDYHLYPIGDIHLGSVHCAEDKIKLKINEIKGMDNALWIGMGDYADSITNNDKRWDSYGLASWVKKDDIIDSQRKKLVEYFKPIKDKCLGLLTGNHEETIHDRHQDAITKHLCSDLGVPYLSYSCFVELHFARRNGSSHVIQIHAWHGAGAAQSDGGKLMRLMRLVNDVQADIYLMGHLHDIIIRSPHRLRCVNGRVRNVPLAAAITGSWLRAYTQPKSGEEIGISYAEKKGYVPNKIGCPVIHIHPDVESKSKEMITIEA